MLMAVLIAAIADLGFFLFSSLVTASPYVMEAHELIAVPGAFLLILIGVEMLDTIKLYSGRTQFMLRSSSSLPLSSLPKR